MTMAMIIVATLAFMAGLLWACFCAQHFVNFALSAELVGHTESVIAVITFHTHTSVHTCHGYHIPRHLVLTHKATPESQLSPLRGWAYSPR